MSRAFVHVAEMLDTLTGGRIHLEVQANLPVPDHILNIINGAPQIGTLGMGGMAEYFPPAGAFEAPYMFRDLDHFYSTVASSIGRELLSEAEKRSGLHVLDVWHQGVRQVTLRDTPAVTPEQFGKIKLRVPPSVMFAEAAKVLGALPTTMTFQNVPMGLQSGVIDGQENPLPTMKVMGIIGLCRYLVMTHHMIGTILPVVGSLQWDQFSKDDQEIITKAFRAGGEYNRRIIEEEERRLVQEFEEQGLTVLYPDLSVFRSRAERSWRRFRDQWGDSLVTQIQAVR
jgi:TRAP-type transport system periplasmic protein